MSVGTDGNLFATVVSMENRVSTALKGPVVAIRGGASSMSPSAAGMHMNRRWGIVGGGFLVMALAHRLAARGQQVTVFDAAPALGREGSAWGANWGVPYCHYHDSLLADSYRRVRLT